MLKEAKFKVKNIKEKSQSGYKIFKTEKDFELVEAETALEALEKSGISTPVKIERIGIIKKSVFTDEELIDANN
ncbi:MAG: hypothetical protein SFT90_01990 [Rickettsiales bacterium]|nr:hypothetical protein [Rickettsiales bacterium]